RGGRGAKVALAVLERLHRLVAHVADDLAAFSGTAVALCRALGLDVCDRAAREAVRRIAEHTRLVAAGSRHEHASVRIRYLWGRGVFAMETDPLAPIWY